MGQCGIGRIAGWTGELCATPTASCADAQCENGGACILRRDQVYDHFYTLQPLCLCPFGFTGSNCGQQDQNACQSAMGGQCQNNGKCQVENGKPVCRCQNGNPTHSPRSLPGAIGELCTDQYGVCAAQMPCAHQGVCRDQQNSPFVMNQGDYQCECTHPWTGNNCTQVKDFCQQQTTVGDNQQNCQNNAHCFPRFSGRDCLCDAQHSGPDCRVGCATY